MADIVLRCFTQLGGAITADDADALAACGLTLLEEPSRLADLSEHLAEQGKPNAAETIADVLAQGKTKNKRIHLTAADALVFFPYIMFVNGCYASCDCFFAISFVSMESRNTTNR